MLDVFLAISIFLWIIIGIGALISERRALVGTGVLLASFLYLKMSQTNNDLMAFMAIFLLWLSLSLLSVAWSLRGIIRREVEAACSFASLGYLPVFAVLLLKYGIIALMGVLLWFPMWYGFRTQYVYEHEKTRMALTYLPALLMAMLFRTFLAVPYGVLLWWLDGDIKKLLDLRGANMKQ
ncbi:hypothetical protein [Pyrococcus kukulkanii]|uniref:hypothetical protein n=1 Tax=Pyrococcus kukulkanii TaxID=1609559 RepID=UPI0035643BAB